MIDNLMNAQDMFEIVRDKIAEILATEIENQKALAIADGLNPEDYNARVYVERTRAFEQFLNVPVADESPLINVTYDASNFDQGNGNVVSRQKSSTTYNIDCYGYGTAEVDGVGQLPGDMQSAFAVQKAIRIVRNILMSANYVYLDLRGIVWQRWINTINVFQPIINNNPVQNVIGARLAFVVQFNEFSPQHTPALLDSIAVDLHRAEDGQVIVQAEYDFT